VGYAKQAMPISLDSRLNQRDVRAVRLIKPLHPERNFARDELQEYLIWRLRAAGGAKNNYGGWGLEYWAVNFPYIDLEAREETFVAVREQIGEG